MCEVIDRENGNDFICAVAINTDVNIAALVFKFVEKLKHKVKTEIK